MKKYWLYILMAVCLTACKGIKTVNSDMEEEQLGCENEIAKAIIWIDWKRGEDISDFHLVRTAKVHVNVYSDGTFRIMSFCKKQEPKVIEYLKKRATVYTIPKFFFDEGYIEPGEQYLQLRYLPEKID